jgi:hypothetical protein
MDVLALVAAIAAIITALVIYWQGALLKGQIELQTLIDLEDQWNSPDMRHARANLARGSGDLLNRLERVLEFLENFATYHRRGALSSRRVWDSNLGWYAARYYFYFEPEIEAVRRKWHDETVYKSLRELADHYVRVEAGVRGVSVDDIRKEFAATKAEFFELETTP